MDEIWKEIPDYPDYKISNMCNVMSFMKYRDGKLLIPNPDNLPTVDHIDQNNQNNDLSNLRWASYKTQNMNKSNTRTDILETDPKERNRIILKESRQRTIASKKFSCEICNKAYDGNYSLQTHYKSKSHLKIINFKPTTKYFCSVCGVNCRDKHGFKSHMIGPKHKRIMENK